MPTHGGDQVVRFIQSLPDFEIDNNLPTTYDHMGALLTDSILQSGLNYKTVVWPRVERILVEFPDAATLTSFRDLLYRHGPYSILSWNHPEKPNRLMRLMFFLDTMDIETEIDLTLWLGNVENATALLGLPGIGPKTVDYMKRLVNLPSIPVDRHIFSFVERAGVSASNYREVQQTVEEAALLLGMHQVILDRAIWSYMSATN